MGGQGVHFDPSAPSDLETLLATHPLDHTALLDRARGAIARIREAHLAKYAVVDPGLPVPDSGYVPVIARICGDASVRTSKGGPARFREVPVHTQEDHPGARVVIRPTPNRPKAIGPGFSDPMTRPTG